MLRVKLSNKLINKLVFVTLEIDSEVGYTRDKEGGIKGHRLIGLLVLASHLFEDKISFFFFSINIHKPNCQ